jgi:hypothetical protein
MSVSLDKPRPPMRVLITGSRKWTDQHIVANILGNYPASAVMVHGGAPGADSIVEEGWGKRTTEVHRPDWTDGGRYSRPAYDRGAGYKRNEKMINLGAEVCIAFCIRDAGGNMSNGTKHCSTKALEAGIPVLYIEVDGSSKLVEPESPVGEVTIGEDPWSPSFSSVPTDESVVL